MNNIQNLCQVKSFIFFFIFTFRMKQKTPSNVMYFTFFEVINSNVPSNYLEIMAQYNKQKTSL
jgi:hypothetical protein